MNTSIVISLDMRREKKDGTYPLMMRLGHYQRTTSIPTGVSLKKDDWNDKDKKIKSSYKGSSSVSYLNNLLQRKKADAWDVIFKLEAAGKLQNMTVADLRTLIDQKRKTDSFVEYAHTLSLELNEAGRIGSARNYEDVSRFFKKYNGGKDLLFQQINYAFLTQLENQHLAKGNSYNGLASVLRTVRAIFNKAIKAGVIESEQYPFSNYKIKTVPTQKRALEMQSLKSIIKKKISPEHPVFDARNYFLASYMMYGMNYTDMAFLQKTNVVAGRIQYRRSKTSKLYDIKVIPQLDKILSHYIKKNPDSPYIFPIIKRDALALQYKDIQWSRKRYNEKLKDLAALCGVEQVLTGYVSRHSFATQAMMREVPLNAISDMLGHSSIKTTQIYLKSLPTKTLDDYNAKILRG